MHLTRRDKGLAGVAVCQDDIAAAIAAVPDNGVVADDGVGGDAHVAEARHRRYAVAVGVTDDVGAADDVSDKGKRAARALRDGVAGLVGADWAHAQSRDGGGDHAALAQLGWVEVERKLVDDAAAGGHRASIAAAGDPRAVHGEAVKVAVESGKVDLDDGVAVGGTAVDLHKEAVLEGVLRISPIEKEAPGDGVQSTGSGDGDAVAVDDADVEARRRLVLAQAELVGADTEGREAAAALS